MIVCNPETGICQEIVEARKDLASWRWSYQVKEMGPNKYGMDTIISDNPKYDLNKMALWVPIADSARRDGVGDRIRIEGIDLERHMKNPLFLFNHGKEKKLPLGSFRERDSGVYTVQKDLVAGTMGGWGYFYQGKDADDLGNGKANKKDQYEHALFCEQTFDMAIKCLINGGSIGYQVKRAVEIPPDYERGTPKGLDLIGTLMLEGSLVILPANMDTVNVYQKVLSDNLCCGKSLDPVLYKSLQHITPERPLVVNVPADVRQYHNIPPARWTPGLGAEKHLSILHPEQDSYRSLMTFDSPLGEKLKALYHVKSLRGRYSKKSVELSTMTLREHGIRARVGDINSWSPQQKTEVLQWMYNGGREPEVLINLPHEVQPDHVVHFKSHGAGPFQGPSGRWFIMKNGHPVPYKKGDKGGAPKAAKSKGKQPSGIKHPKVATPAAKTEEDLAKLDQEERSVPQEGPTSKNPPVIPAHLKKPDAAQAFVVKSRIGGYIPKVGPIHHSSVVICPKNEAPVIQDGNMPKSNPGCLSLGIQPGTETFQVEPQRINAVAEASSAPAHEVIQRIENFRKPYSLLSNNCQHAAAEVTTKSMIKSLRMRYRQKGMFTRAIGGALKQVALSAVPLPIKVAGGAIRGILGKDMGQKCMTTSLRDEAPEEQMSQEILIKGGFNAGRAIGAAVAAGGKKVGQATKLGSGVAKFTHPLDTLKNGMETIRKVGVANHIRALNLKKSVKSLRMKYNKKALDWAYWGKLALRVLTDKNVLDAVDKLPGYVSALRNLFNRGIDAQAAGDVIAKLWLAYRREHPDEYPPETLPSWVKCMEGMSHNGKSLGAESKRLLTKMIYNKDLGRDIVEANFLLANPEEAKHKGLMDSFFENSHPPSKPDSPASFERARKLRAEVESSKNKKEIEDKAKKEEGKIGQKGIGSAMSTIGHGLRGTMTVLPAVGKAPVSTKIGNTIARGVQTAKAAGRTAMAHRGKIGAAAGVAGGVALAGGSAPRVHSQEIYDQGYADASKKDLEPEGHKCMCHKGLPSSRSYVNEGYHGGSEVGEKIGGPIGELVGGVVGGAVGDKYKKKCICGGCGGEKGFAGTVAAFTPATNKVTNAVAHVNQALRGGGQAVAKKPGLMGQASGFARKVAGSASKGLGESAANLGLSAIGADPIKSLRQKYRGRSSVKARIKRLRNSTSGSTLMRVHEKDLAQVEADAKSMGLQFSHMGRGKVKLIGSNEHCDGIAKKYGRPWR